MSNAPTMLMGLVPLIRATVRSAATGNLTTTVTPDDSGTMFISLTTGTHAYTLPAVADAAGKHFIFFDGETTQSITVTSPANDIMGNNTTADVATSNADLGDCLMVFSDGTNYFKFVLAGTWTVA